MKNYNDKHRPSSQPLSDSTIPIRLADIRKRCSDLLDDDGEMTLTLEDDNSPDQAFNPYDRGI